MSFQKCRFCNNQLQRTFCNLGMSPLSNAFLKPEHIHQMEPFFPLHAYVCEQCYLVQLEEFETPANIFTDYAYFSSYSESWLKHCKAYTEYMIQRFGINQQSRVIEIASNDGYLLKYFKENNIDVLGVEPAENVANVALLHGIPTLVKFFGSETATQMVHEGVTADLLLGNNVLAHVPDLNDFVMGLKILLKEQGVITLEFPNLVRLMEDNQFDTIYHEHFSYFSFLTIEQIFLKHGLPLFDVEELPTHGGSIRIFAQHKETGRQPTSANVEIMRNKERKLGLDKIETYADFAESVRETKRNLLEFLIEAKRQKKTVVGYGAPAKGNTLLNYCGIREDFIEYTVDLSPHKQNHYLPGTHIPIYHPDKIKETQPDYILILPWNLRDEIIAQMSYIREWGGKFVVPVPSIEVID